MKVHEAYPLRFAPVYKEAIWGGANIATRYGRTTTPAICAESWEISAHPDGAGKLLNGPWQGATLAELSAQHGRSLLGAAAPEDQRFPLLFKIIDARDNLSLQLHPNAALAAQIGTEPKNESWYLLDADANALIYAGFQPAVNAEMLRAALAGGDAERLFIRHTAARGLALHIPAGLAHAIGAGCLIYEVQQSSNTTYRLFDWNRRDTAGNPRALHLEEGLRAIDWGLPPPALQQAETRAGQGRNRWGEWPANPYFRMRRLTLAEEESLTPQGRSFVALFVEQGAVEASTAAATVQLATGDSCLIPACTANCNLRPLANNSALLVTILE